MIKYLIQKPNIKDSNTNEYIGGKFQIINETYLHLNMSRLKNFPVISLSEKDLVNLSADGFYKVINGITYYYNSVDPCNTYTLQPEEEKVLTEDAMIQPIEIKDESALKTQVHNNKDFLIKQLETIELDQKSDSRTDSTVSKGFFAEKLK